MRQQVFVPGGDTHDAWLRNTERKPLPLGTEINKSFGDIVAEAVLVFSSESIPHIDRSGFVTAGSNPSPIGADGHCSAIRKSFERDYALTVVVQDQCELDARATAITRPVTSLATSVP